MTNLKTFDLNLLRVLDVLADDPSTVRAGERLGLSQPAVSAALGRLRAAMDDELFFRRGKHLEPTDRVLALKAGLRQVLEQIEVLVAEPTEFDPRTSDAEFKISGSDFFAELLMPRLAGRLQAIAPSMRIHLVDLVPDGHFDTLDRYDVDLAIIPKSPVPDWIDSSPAFESSFSVVARKGNPRLRRAGLSGGDVIPVDLFCDTGHVLFSPEGNSTAMGDAALAKVGRERRVVMTMPTFSGVYRAVSGSDHIALLPTALAHHVAKPAGLCVYRSPVALPNARLQLIWNRRHSKSPAHKWLRDEISDVLSALDER